MDLVARNIFLGYIVLTRFANIECIWSKNSIFLDILQKLKLFVLTISIFLCLNTIKIPKQYEIKAHYCKYA